jgi:hypothetical protein
MVCLQERNLVLARNHGALAIRHGVLYGAQGNMVCSQEDSVCSSCGLQKVQRVTSSTVVAGSRVGTQQPLGKAFLEPIHLEYSLESGDGGHPPPKVEQRHRFGEGRFVAPRRHRYYRFSVGKRSLQSMQARQRCSVGSTHRPDGEEEKGEEGMPSWSVQLCLVPDTPHSLVPQEK